MASDFDPRQAALRYAADTDLNSPDGTNALVCALVYVGDEIRQSRQEASPQGFEAHQEWQRLRRIGVLTEAVKLLDPHGVDTQITPGLKALVREELQHGRTGE